MGSDSPHQHVAPHNLTGKQTYVLNNLHRVEKRHYKITAHGRPPRYQIDGWECTSQIHGLGAKGFIARDEKGALKYAARALGRTLSHVSP